MAGDRRSPRSASSISPCSPGVRRGSPVTLALSFSLYGFVRKVISVEALPGLATETLLLLPLAAGYLLWCEAARQRRVRPARARAIAALLIGSGIVTAVPLFLFAYAARLLPYSTVGVLQYIGPSLQLPVGVLLFHERFGARARGRVRADLGGAGDLCRRRGAGGARAGGTRERAQLRAAQRGAPSRRALLLGARDVLAGARVDADALRPR